VSLSDAHGGTEDAPAKINLDLRITGRRADGYHELDSLVVFTALGDRLGWRPADAMSLSVQGPFARETPSDDNIVLRAASTLAHALPDIWPAAFVLEKNLPVASGMGGGSTDAAAAMRVLVRHAGSTISGESLRDIGALIGADLPVCIYGKPARMRGTGLRLDPVRGLPEIPLVLVNPGVELATAAVFGAYDAPFSPEQRPALPLLPSVTQLAMWLRQSSNDLEPAARRLAPVIDQVLAALGAQDGVLLARLTGSGATCFGMFSDIERAERAAAAIARSQPQWWVSATTAPP